MTVPPIVTSIELFKNVPALDLLRHISGKGSSCFGPGSVMLYANPLADLIESFHQVVSS